jgi:hypothetical protein
MLLAAAIPAHMPMISARADLNGRAMVGATCGDGGSEAGGRL